ncbi:STAS domain-containing protein [Marinobacter sp. CA1]|uniref:STAS domain-containing protein n=1 Tax=Marinobacter sp. CA1 TaxID=2817656 RepID=UPI001D063078|nr:STAS domain-containing protein [Marinobacter sp. CA1]UDL07037.1 STAS domain-containing protein [Marinobacter sp. CA1]
MRSSNAIKTGLRSNATVIPPSVLSMPEKVVMNNADEISVELLSRIDQGEHIWVINLTETAFMDSSGLAVLISAWKKVQQAGGVMLVAQPTPTVRALLELTRLHELFEIYEDVNDAIEQATR